MAKVIIDSDDQNPVAKRVVLRRDTYASIQKAQTESPATLQYADQEFLLSGRRKPSHFARKVRTTLSIWQTTAKSHVMR